MKQSNQPLRSPDATEGATEVDPLSVAASGLEAPKYPTLAPDRIAKFKIKKCAKAPVKADASRELMTLTLQTEEDLPDTDGRTLRKGFSVFHRIGLTPSAGSDDKRPRTLEQIAGEMGQILKWCGLNDKTPRNWIDNPSLVEGYVGPCRIGLGKETADFPASNTVKFVLPG